MTTTILRRTLHRLLSPRLFSTLPNLPKSQTPTEKQFESWVHFLKPGFTTSDVNHALTSQNDADLAYDIFRWTSQQRNYSHDSSTYLTIIQISVTNHRHRYAESLLDEVLAGACAVNLHLYNTLIRYCCSHRCLFNRAFDVYKKMMDEKTHQNCKPNLETYAMLFNVLLRKFNKLNVSFVYLNAVKSLTKQMKAVGVVPDTYVLNMIIKAYAKCLNVGEAVRVFREMGLYGCEANAFTYSCLIKGFCEKERVDQGFEFFKEMRGKELVPTGSAFMVMVCSLALEKRFEDAVEVLRDMLGNSLKPDLLTYKTLLEEMCREGLGVEALELLEEFWKKDVGMGNRMYKTLLDNLHFVERGLGRVGRIGGMVVFVLRCVPKCNVL